MTHEEIHTFFTQVKGKKIRFSHWDICSYFIPKSIFETEMNGIIYSKYSDPEHISFNVRNGFNNYETYHWEFYDKQSARKSKSHLPDFL